MLEHIVARKILQIIPADNWFTASGEPLICFALCEFTEDGKRSHTEVCPMCVDGFVEVQAIKKERRGGTRLF